MRERLALLREYLKNRLAFGKNKKTRKGFILTMVALVEVLAISVVSVSAWVETISTITIKAEGAKIDNYVYTNADIGSGNGYSGKTIDLTKYFRAAGGVHLASASSADGENIFFPIKKSDVSDFGANSYRCADVNDKNVNYIDFSFNVKVDKTFNANHAEFYLDQVPKITIGGADVSGNLVRMAITDTDTQNTVVCGSEASNKNVVSKAEGNQTPETVRAFSDFVVNPESEPTELFRVDKGSSKTINIKVWLQDDKATTEYAGKTVSISGVNIVTQNKKGNKVYFVDRTVNEDIKNLNKIIENNSCDAIVTNPPYMKKNSGIKNENEIKLISRHEIKCNIEDIIKVSSKLLKDNGELYMVHRPDRLVGIIEFLRKYKIEPKKIRFVYSKKEDNSNLVLIKAVKNAGEFLKIEKPLYIYDENNKYTDEVLGIYNKK